MLVLKIIGFVLLGIVALIVLLLSVRVRIFAEYSEIDTKVMLQWLFIKIPLFPSEKKEKTEKKAPKTRRARSKKAAPAAEAPAETAE